MSNPNPRTSHLEKKVDVILGNLATIRKEIESIKTTNRYQDTIIFATAGDHDAAIVGEFQVARITMIGAGSAGVGATPGKAGEYKQFLAPMKFARNIAAVVGKEGGNTSVVVEYDDRTVAYSVNGAGYADSADTAATTTTTSKFIQFEKGAAGESAGPSAGGRGGAGFTVDKKLVLTGEIGHFGAGGGAGALKDGVRHAGGAGGDGLVMIELF
jgi:hypothetical protein